MNQLLITIFTTTYNRGDLLPRLYNSLKAQTVKNFEWVIVDDGSSDLTAEVVNHFMKENMLPITFLQKENEGKHIAINQGVELAKGELFFIVDSDDYLTKDAVETILYHKSKIKSNEFCGLIFNRLDPLGHVIGGDHGIDEIISSLYDLKLKLTSDKAEVFKTDIISKFKFPQFIGEKFAPEALVMFRMSGIYKVHYINKGIYVGEYLEGGLTSSITKVRMMSPRSTTLYYIEQFQRGHNVLEKIKSVINYYRFQSNDFTIKHEIPFLFKILKPFGVAMFIKDKFQLKK